MMTHDFDHHQSRNKHIRILSPWRRASHED